jgi:exopolysaccharide biosynthesis polyprenyl glycosylphosphotransferase
VSTISAPLPAELTFALDERTLQRIEDRRGVGVRGRGWLVRRALLAADLFGLLVSFLIAQRLFPGRNVPVDRVSSAVELGVFFLSLPGFVIAAKIYGLYDKDEERTDHSTTDDFAGVFHLVTVCTWLLYACLYLLSWADPQLPKMFAFWLVAIMSMTLLRAAARAYCRRQVNYLQNTVIVGAGEIGQKIACKLLNHREYGINLVGFVDGQPMERDDALEHLTVLGDLGELPEIVRLLDVERVIFAFSNDSHEEMLSLIRRLNALNVQVDVVPRFFDVLSPGAGVHTVEGLPMIGLPPMRLGRSSMLLKRAVDVVGAGAGLVLFSPLMLSVALLIKADGEGPVFFRQVRMGTGHECFRIFKFRTMAVDAEARKHEVAHLNKHLGGDARMFKIDDDPRVTRIGRWLRRYSLDELPQLINVLVGDMSLVGPRPLILDEHRYVNSWASRRLDLRPGITGLWQVLGRDEIGFDEMVKLDYLYVTTWTLANDLKMLVRTIPRVLLPGLRARSHSA